MMSYRLGFSLKVCFTAALLLLVPVAVARAQYTYTVANGKTTITRYTGSGGAVTIPSTLGGGAVTCIGDEAFDSCTSLTSVTIPNGVTNIEYGAFDQCFSLTSVTIPTSVTRIGGAAFRSCQILADVAIPVNVTSIGRDAFSYCRSFTSITIPASVTRIEGHTFQSCSSLTNVTIPSSVTIIEDHAFDECNNLISITIPDSVISIWEGAFGNCTALTSVMIPSSVTNIENDVFSGCDALAEISVSDSNLSYRSLSGILYNKPLTTIIACPVQKMGVFTIPSSVTNMNHALGGCYRLTGIIIPSSVTRIGDGEFGGCAGLLSVTIPSSVKSIGTFAFSGCGSLASVTIPSSVTSIREYTFAYCRRLSSVMIPGGVTNIGYQAFLECTNLTVITIPASMTYIEDYAFQNCSSLARLYFSGNAPNIGYDPFLGVHGTVYYLLGTTGWTNPWEGLTAVGVAASDLTPSYLAVGVDVTTVGVTNGIQISANNSGDGGMSIQLGGVNVLGDSQMAGIQWSITGSGVLAFDWRVSSEATYDWLRFYEVGGTVTNQMSGATGGWSRVNVTINGASDTLHTFRWEYEKDSADYVGQDCGWVDAISWSSFYTLAVTNGTGGGSYTNGRSVAIVAAAPPAWQRFDRWTGDTLGVANVFASTTTISMPATNAALTATYTPILYTLAVTNGSGGGSYPYASNVEIRATVYEGKRFYRWSGSIASVADVTAATTTVLTTDHTLSLTATYSVTLTVSNGAGSGAYVEGTTATVRSDPDGLWKEFYVWTGADAGLLINASARTTSLVMPTRSTTLSATYRDSIARVAGCYGRTFTNSGTTGGISVDATAGSPSGTPAVKLGGTGIVPDNGFAAFQTVVLGSGSVTFWWKVSSEASADYLKFMVDGSVVTNVSGTKGTWGQVSNRVEGASSHILRWEYAKNGSSASSTDAGWVDDIIWTGDVPVPAITPDVYTVAVTTGYFTISFLGERGIPYTIYSNATLESTNWAPMAIVPHVVEETNGLFRYEATVPQNDGQPACFYRMFGGTNFDYIVINLSGGTGASSYPVTYYGTSNSVPGGVNSDAYKTTNLLMRLIPAGVFTMGSPTNELGRLFGETQHVVTLTKSYYMGVFEVTQKQWELVMGTKPSIFNNASYYATRPVEQVSYNDIRGSSVGSNWPASSMVDATSFMGKLRVKSGLTAFDLPTESQWEYACRAGTATGLNSGKNPTNTEADVSMSEVGRYWYNGPEIYGFASSVGTNGATAKVGSYRPNASGLYDMHGNVWERCLDWFDTYPSTATDPVGAASGSQRVRRGGGWGCGTDECRSASRDNYGYPDYRNYDVGFRAAMTLP